PSQAPPQRARASRRAPVARVRLRRDGLSGAPHRRSGGRGGHGVPHEHLGRGRRDASQPLARAHQAEVSATPTPWLGAVCLLFCRAHMADLSLSRSQLLLLAGTANRPLAEEMAKHLGQPLCAVTIDRKSTRLNSSHVAIAYAVCCLNSNITISTTPVIAGDSF